MSGYSRSSFTQTTVAGFDIPQPPQGLRQICANLSSQVHQGFAAVLTSTSPAPPSLDFDCVYATTRSTRLHVCLGSLNPVFLCLPWTKAPVSANKEQSSSVTPVTSILYTTYALWDRSKRSSYLALQHHQPRSLDTSLEHKLPWTALHLSVDHPSPLDPFRRISSHYRKDPQS